MTVITRSKSAQVDVDVDVELRDARVLSLRSRSPAGISTFSSSAMSAAVGGRKISTP